METIPGDVEPATPELELLFALEYAAGIARWTAFAPKAVPVPTASTPVSTAIRKEGV